MSTTVSAVKYIAMAAGLGLLAAEKMLGRRWLTDQDRNAVVNASLGILMSEVRMEVSELAPVLMIMYAIRGAFLNRDGGGNGDNNPQQEERLPLRGEDQHRAIDMA